MSRRSKMARFKGKAPLEDVHDAIRFGGHRMACCVCGVIGQWGGSYGVYTRPNTARVCGYIICRGCVALDPEVIKARVEALVVSEERFESASRWEQAS